MYQSDGAVLQIRIDVHAEPAGYIAPGPAVPDAGLADLSIFAVGIFTV